jgi:transposase
MAKPLLPDGLWTLVKNLLPPVPSASTNGDRPTLPHKHALIGIPFVLKTGPPWEDLPAELNCGCGMTCWRRLRARQAEVGPNPTDGGKTAVSTALWWTGPACRWPLASAPPAPAT